MFTALNYSTNPPNPNPLSSRTSQSPLVSIFIILNQKQLISNPEFQVQIPKWLAQVPFVEIYEKPPPPEPGVTRLPEEIEAEIKKQEQEFDKLIFVNLK